MTSCQQTSPSVGKMKKILLFTISSTLFMSAAFAQSEKTLADGIAQGSGGLGLSSASTEMGNNKTITTIVEFRTFIDPSARGSALVFVNASVLYNVVGSSSYNKLSMGGGANLDLFFGDRLKASDSSDVVTLHYGVNESFHGQKNFSNSAALDSDFDYDVGVEAGLFVMKKNNVFTVAPTLTTGGAVASLRNADGSNAVTGTYTEGKVEKSVSRVGEISSPGIGARARYLYADKIYAMTDYIYHGGRPRESGELGSENFMGNVYHRFFTTGRVRLSKKLSAGGDYKFLSFQSVDGKPLRVHRVSATLTRIF
jgi:hypothetical protein